MGAAKFPEEIVERYVETFDGLETSVAADSAVAVAVKPKLMYCPLCFAGYLEESALDKHVAGTHGKQHIYLKVNDQIVRDVCWTRRSIKECMLVLRQIESVEISIHVDGQSTTFKIDQSTSLLEHILKKSVEGMIKIEVHGRPFGHSFSLYQGRQPTFRSDRLDKILHEMFEMPSQIGTTDLIALRDRCRRLGLNDLEDRYLNGILEYCHGTSLEMESKTQLARPRLESAMDLLIPFCTPIAEQMRHALSLRMNCFAGQWGCPADSIFGLSERFFCTSDHGDSQAKLTTSPADPSIWLDPVSKKILQALRAVEDDDHQRVFSILKSIHVRDRNDEDKVTLIKARTQARMGNVRGALASYEGFVAHPIFGEEAAQYKRQHSA